VEAKIGEGKLVPRRVLVTALTNLGSSASFGKHQVNVPAVLLRRAA
jgi:hypothetical protein